MTTTSGNVQQTTCPSQGTEPRELAVFDWALHWVYPRSEIVPLDVEEITIGRDASCRCVMNDTEISRHHATLLRRGSGCRLLDAQSRNGSRVDGERVAEAALEDGSVLRFGGAVGVIVHSPTARAPLLTLSQGTKSYLGSGKLQAVVEQAAQFGPLAEPVFIHGESGTGKEMVAELVHRASSRSGKYLALNCASVRGDLAAAAIFGHTRGAFTGAVEAQPGAARDAHRGTLFLDEVAELTLEVQPLLLRLLQSGDITPVGSSQSLHVDARVVSATHRDLWALCQSGGFREDLYFRITPYELRLPALRERREDILALFCHFSGRERAGMSAGFVAALLGYGWPGNVRELQNFAAKLKASAGREAVWRSRLAPCAAETKGPATAEARASALAPSDWAELCAQHAGVAASISRATGIAVSTVKRHLHKHGLRS